MRFPFSIFCFCFFFTFFFWSEFKIADTIWWISATKRYVRKASKCWVNRKHDPIGLLLSCNISIFSLCCSSFEKIADNSARLVAIATGNHSNLFTLNHPFDFICHRIQAEIMNANEKYSRYQLVQSERVHRVEITLRFENDFTCSAVQHADIDRKQLNWNYKRENITCV